MPLTVLFRPTAHDSRASFSPVELRFDDDAIRIGRASGCELRLPHPSVSDQHAVLRPVDGEWTLTDESSLNGTWVNGARLTPNARRAIRDGDLVRVGSVWLELRVDRTPVDARANRSTRELALDLLGRFLEVRGVAVTVVEGPDMGRRLALIDEERPYLVGRSSHCDLKLVDAGASREHVRLIRRGQEVLVSDAGTKNGILLGEAPIAAGQTVRWLPSLALRAGATVLALDVPPTLEAVAARAASGEPPELISKAPSAVQEPAAASKVPPSALVAVASPVVSQAVGAGGLKAPRSKSTWGEITLFAGAILILGFAVACVWLILFQ
jgi:pSer/pThr/pTyr-binding forkhead associated (FHA) protein